ncbi:MAG: hypothetical protein ACKO2P_21080 [Planctomycetota bacterium]
MTLISANSGIRDVDQSQALFLKDPLDPTVELSQKSDTWTTAVDSLALADLPDTNPGDGVSLAITGDRTLRAAIMESNASPGIDVVQLGPGVYQLSTAGDFEDAAATGDLDVTGELTIRGQGADVTFIDGGFLDRVFHVHPGARLTLQNMTIRNGRAFEGGGIYNAGTLTLLNVNVICSIAGSQGGGIYNTGTITGNVVSVSQNIAGSRGGAINNLGSITLTSTTLSTNYAGSRGGGLFNEPTGTVLLQNVSVINNESGSRGGGINSETNAAVTIVNTLLERNVTDADLPGSTASSSLDFHGILRSLGFNRIQVMDQTFINKAAAGLLAADEVGSDSAPLVTSTGDLTYLGGNGVGYNPLIPGSAAIDAGSNALYPNTPIISQKDGGGNPRLVDGNRDGDLRIDVGATEFLTNIPVAIFTANPNPSALGETIFFDATRSSHPNPFSGRTISQLQWFFDWPNPTPTLTTAGDQRTTTFAYNDASRLSYTVRLVVTDSLGASSFVETQVLVGRPTVPVISRPFSVTTDRTPEIRWSASPAKYKVVLKQTGSPDVTLAENLSTTSFTPANDLAPGNYRVVVIASNAMGESTSDELAFTITTISPTRPSGTTFDLTPFFSWSDIPGSSRYELAVDRTQPVRKTDVIRQQFIPTNSYETPSSIGIGTYTWSVRAFDGDDNPGAWSAVQTFTIAQVAITKPLTPTMDTTPTFEWTDPGAFRYEFWVNQVGGQVKLIYTIVQGTSFTPTTPLPNGTFDAWVRPLAADGEAGLWSQKYTFQMDYRLGPQTIAPIGVSTDSTPTFRWQAIDAAVRYDLWVDNLSTGVKQVIRLFVNHIPGAKEITYTPTTALSAANYRWWVQAIGADGRRTAWSRPTDFNVPVPVIVAPRGAINTNLPNFVWRGVAEYVRYDLWVDNLTTGQKQVLRLQDLTGTSYQTVLPFENGSFRAWLRGFDKDNNVSQWSASADFSISVGVGDAPTLIGPSGVTTSRPTFRWTGGTRVVTYEILVKDISQASQPIVINQRGLQSGTLVSPITLTAGRTYRWWVRGLDAGGNGLPWSQPLDFRVVSSDSPEQPNGDGDAPLIAGLNLNTVFTTVMPAVEDDGFRSVSVHATGVVVQLDPEVIELPAAAPVVDSSVTEATAEIDTLMAEFLASGTPEKLTGFEAVPAVPTVASAPVVADGEPATQKAVVSRTSILAMLAGLVLPRIVRRNDDEEGAANV